MFGLMTNTICLATIENIQINYVNTSFQVDIWEALQVQRPNTPGYIPDEEEKALQR